MPDRRIVFSWIFVTQNEGFGLLHNNKYTRGNIPVLEVFSDKVRLFCIQ